MLYIIPHSQQLSIFQKHFSGPCDLPLFSWMKACKNRTPMPWSRFCGILTMQQTGSVRRSQSQSQSRGREQPEQPQIQRKRQSQVASEPLLPQYWVVQVCPNKVEINLHLTQFRRIKDRWKNFIGMFLMGCHGILIRPPGYLARDALSLDNNGCIGGECGQDGAALTLSWLHQWYLLVLIQVNRSSS